MRNIRVETNPAMVYYLHPKTGLYSIRHKISLNDALRHLSDREIYRRNRPFPMLDKGIYYTLYRKANKIQRVKETRGIQKWSSNIATLTRLQTDSKSI